MDEINKTSHENITHLAANTLYFLRKNGEFSGKEESLLLYQKQRHQSAGTEDLSTVVVAFS